MAVVATAGHVDHGKSTLVRALTGMEPDRWAEEKRRGMTIDLGFAWTMLPSGRDIAFVDVPGHERFLPNMLAGVGPVPAVMLVVAADEGWMPQSAEHLAALHALDVRHGLIAVTRSDRADPIAVMRRALNEVAATSLGTVEAVAVSGVTGQGLDDLRLALDRLVDRLPAPDETGDVRLWVDRSFVIRGSGVVITGTLGAGTIRTGDELVVARSGQHVRVRAVQTRGSPVDQVRAVARVALNLRGVEREAVARGDALLTPGRFAATDVVDARLAYAGDFPLPKEAILYVGSAAVPARVRPLGVDAARLTLASALPLRIGDRAVLRDAARQVLVGGATVLDVRPPTLRRRGAAAARAEALATLEGRPDELDELRRRGLVRRHDLEAMGVAVTVAPVAGEWLADPAHWKALRARLGEVVDEHSRERPLDEGLALEAARQRLGLPERALVEALVAPPLTVRDGRIVRASERSSLPSAVEAAVQAVAKDLAQAPFAAPEADRLTELGLGPRELAAAARTGALLRVSGSIVLLPGADQQAAKVLAELEQPFTLSAARQALGTTRRVAIPLLELLDRSGLTRRLPDDRRTTG